MNYVTVIGFVAAGLVIATLSMRTMVPLRIVGIASNCAFVTYGILFGSVPTVVLHTILLPLNIYRLREMLNLVKQVKVAAQGDMSMDWLKPFMSKRSIKAGDILFQKGDEADHVYFVVSGRLHHNQSIRQFILVHSGYIADTSILGAYSRLVNGSCSRYWTMEIDW
jgi:CRP/FNR family cyclic AMP-dependent transcriptional regulator